MASSSGKSNTVEDRIKVAKTITDKETQDTTSSLNQSKGRGQVTATAAMSITNVALLKTILDRGTEYNKYYELSLVLVSISLVLQILAGFFSLLLDQTMNYFSKHGSNYCDDLAEFWCPWRCLKNNDGGHDHETSRLTGSKNPLLNSWEMGGDAESGISHVLASSREDPFCTCCPFICTNKVYASHEIVTLEKYNDWRQQLVTNQLMMTRASEELEYQTEIVADAKKRHEELLAAKAKPGADPAEIESKIAELQEIVRRATESKKKYERELQRQEIIQEQGKMLAEYAESIGKSRVLKFAAYWQQQLNYIFYIIFILNIFITGFGLDTKPSYSAAPITNNTVSA